MREFDPFCSESQFIILYLRLTINLTLNKLELLGWLRKYANFNKYERMKVVYSVFLNKNNSDLTLFKLITGGISCHWDNTDSVF